jgi:hypothetical protein
MRDLTLIDQLRTTAAFKAFDPSSRHLVQLLRTAADRLEHLTDDIAHPVVRRGHDESSTTHAH